MSLREDMWRYEQITGESAEHVPIIKLGAFLDGYDMGIKALEQEPCEDCISREAVITKIEDEDRLSFMGVFCDHDAAMGFRETIKELPSVNSQEPKTEWIPVTERLPKKTGKYLVTVRNGNVYAGTFDETSGRFQCAATAWMPLPEPYKEESKIEQALAYADQETLMPAT